MKRLDKKTVKGFVTGVLASVLVATTIAPAAASTLREIRVAMGGIQIYVDGNLKKPTDANGNVVEPMIYNGTTYLPVRAVTGMLTDKEVSWDGNKQIVYIGKKPESGGESVALDTLKPFSRDAGAKHWNAPEMYVGKNAVFTILGETYTPFNCIGVAGGGTITYKVDSGYQSLHGEAVMAYDNLGETAQDTLGIYSVDQYGEETLLKEYSVKCGDAPVDVEVNVSGCNFIRLRMESSYLKLYNVTLTTAE